MYFVRGLCLFLVVIYAWDRFNTPATNRSSTRRMLYWSSCGGYIICAVALFVTLSFAFEMDAVRTMLLRVSLPGGGPEGGNEGTLKTVASLPAPLIAALTLTTLMPLCPVIKRADGWLLGFFLDMGSIPAEVKRLAEELRPQALRLTQTDVEELTKFIDETELPEGLQTHIRAARGEGLDLSRYRFTRVLQLYRILRTLRLNTRYEKFFSDNETEFTDLTETFVRFARRSDTVLTLAANVKATASDEVYEELMRDKREEYRENCANVFRLLAQFLARAVLRSEPGERDIKRTLRGSGFEFELPTLPDFPIHSLTGLAIALLLMLLMIGGPLKPFLPKAQVSLPWDPRLLPLLVVVTHAIAVGATIKLMQRSTFFRRAPGAPRRYAAYLLCGLLGAAVTVLASISFVLLQTGNLAESVSLPPLLWVISARSGVLALAVALFSDNWPENVPEPWWLRSLEAVGCGAATAGASWLLAENLGALNIFGGEANRAFLFMIALSGAIGALMGGFVPHIYRSARNAGAARSGTAPAATPILTTPQLS